METSKVEKLDKERISFFEKTKEKQQLVFRMKTLQNKFI